MTQNEKPMRKNAAPSGGTNTAGTCETFDCPHTYKKWIHCAKGVRPALVIRGTVLLTNPGLIRAGRTPAGRVLSSHGHHAGRAKAVAVTVASRLAEATGGAEIRARADSPDPHGLARG